jgi:hypothetical protein
MVSRTTVRRDQTPIHDELLVHARQPHVSREIVHINLAQRGPIAPSYGVDAPIVGSKHLTPVRLARENWTSLYQWLGVYSSQSENSSSACFTRTSSVVLGEQLEAHRLRAFVFDFEVARHRSRPNVEWMRLAGSSIREGF